LVVLWIETLLPVLMMLVVMPRVSENAPPETATWPVREPLPT